MSEKVGEKDNIPVTHSGEKTGEQQLHASILAVKALKAKKKKDRLNDDERRANSLQTYEPFRGDEFAKALPDDLTKNKFMQNHDPDPNLL